MAAERPTLEEMLEQMQCYLMPSPYSGYWEASLGGGGDARDRMGVCGAPGESASTVVARLFSMWKAAGSTEFRIYTEKERAEISERCRQRAEFEEIGESAVGAAQRARDGGAAQRGDEG